MKRILIADNQKLRIISWADYVPADLIAAFKKETGIDVEVTLSNNEEMISKLRATGGAGYDLAQPSQDRITGRAARVRHLQADRPLQGQARRVSARAARDRAQEHHLDGKTYGLPYLWGTDGLVVNTKRAKIADYTDLCSPELKGKTSVRCAAHAHGLRLRRRQGSVRAVWRSEGLRRAHGSGRRHAHRLQGNFKFFYDNKDQLLNGIRSGEVVAAMMWDTGGWTLNRENPDIQFIVPVRALGWLDTFALPARGRNDAAAYAWINFTMRPENAARVIKSVGNFSAAKDTERRWSIPPQGAIRRGFPEALQEHSLVSRHTRPGLEEIEGRVLDRVKAAN
jgi:spermidine/putrescine transport system substrate-binding protein